MPGSQLAVLGLGVREELVYRVLLGRPNDKLASLSRACGIGQAECRRCLARLEAKGLISRAPGRRSTFVPAPPDLAIEVLIRQRQADLERARLAAVELVGDFRRSEFQNSPSEVVEIAMGRDAVLQRYMQLQRSAIEEFRSFSRVPYANFSGPNEDEIEVLKRGIRYRVLYDRETLALPRALDLIRMMISAGEEARISADVPMKMHIADRRTGIVPLNTGEPGIEGILLIHASPLLEALVRLFDVLWGEAVPIGLREEASSDSGGFLTEETRNLLALMASGLQDEAIARQLDVSLRTVRTRTRILMDHAGARTRFQAGLQAAKRGWL